MNKSVVMVCSQYPPIYGGAGQQAKLLSQTLVSRGWEVAVVTLDQKGVGSSLGQGLGVVRLLRGIAGTGKLQRALTTIALGLGAASIILKRRPTAVHVHGAYWWSIPAVLAGRLVSATTVVKVTRDGEDDPETVLGRKFLRAVPLGWLYGLSLRASDYVVVLSTEAYEKAKAFVPAKRLRLVRNGVDLHALDRTEERRESARKKYGVGPETKVTTFIGYLVEHKGILDLLSAWKLRSKTSNSELWLVGPYEGFYRELTSRAISEISAMQAVGFKIRLFGHVDPQEMPSIYWASDVFTLPSYSEGMPNSLAEAIAAGCVVVGTAIPGITDIARLAPSVLIEPGDVHALTKALDSAELIGHSNFSEHRAGLGIENTASLIEELYVSST
ncbi:MULTISPECIES: glycosyltransferase family 4 protein [Arthrobacter]|uniref:D-inositol 3-phosphate glycosyltransferase n=1 Tax=Arthrobacter bambusae TaxID=1338426 RepID=A0AAW8D6Y4_9MICC|nr:MULTISPECIES: glycosyltransferase family 4 protein [Arthrobacter]MDP9903653.1 glycosyltransferase involved in cell wall biosynthesis [Arthrobacter bambusae]MDQ0128353.1 glycosyltransferase involved in cell wall biosynthesis [Arthrobacter bambusae]MDQ0179694.1 glycosyltransferase involved in cell wall biosynthesis [Arthrobacter bambusae]